MNASLDSRRILIPLAGRPMAAADARTSARVKRYRLGRMPLHTRPDPATDRFAHLRRGYD